MTWKTGERAAIRALKTPTQRMTTTGSKAAVSPGTLVPPRSVQGVIGFNGAGRHNRERGLRAS
jgi:hypothetical protein